MHIYVGDIKAGFLFGFNEFTSASLPNDLEDIWLDGWRLACKWDSKVEWFSRVTRQREKNILARDIEWRVESRHGVWSTFRIDTVERMGPELLAHWIGE